MRPLVFSALGLTACALAAAEGDPLQRCRAIPEPMSRLACYDAIPAAPNRAPAPQPSPERFGLPQTPDAAAAQSIVSSVGPNFVGWDPNTRIRLENGQVWQVVDGSAGAIGPANRKVLVRRGVLGSYFLEFEGLNISPRVRRVQ